MTSRHQHQHPPGIAAWLGLGLLIAGSALAVSAPGPWLPASTADWERLAGLAIALTAAGVFQVEFRRGEETEAVDLFEAALMPVLLFFAGPIALLLTIAAKAVSQIRLRVHPVKALFNVGQWALATGIGVIVFLAIAPSERGAASALPALLVATIATMAVSHASLVAILCVVQRRSPVAVVTGLRAMILPSWIVGGGANLSLGVLFCALSSWMPAALPLALVPLALFDAAHRGSASARTDRARLASLQRATAVLARPVDPQDAVEQFLDEVRGCFDAERAVLVDAEEGDGRLLNLAFGLATTPVVGRVSVEDPGPWQAELESLGHRDALAAPILHDTRVVGVLMVLGLGGLAGTSEGEVAVLGAMAAELGSAMQRSDLVRNLLEERRLLSEIFDTTSDGVCAIRVDGTVATWNRALERMTGYSAEEMTISESLAVLEATDSMGEPVRIGVAGSWGDLPDEIQILDRFGRAVWFGCSYAEAPAGPGGPSMLVVSVRDITSSREETRLKNEFASIASHELRTPVTVLQGMSSLLLGQWNAIDDARREEALRSLLRSSSRLQAVVDNVLVLAQAEATEVGRLHPVSLGRLCPDVVAEARELAPERSIRLDPACASTWVTGCTSSVTQILSNLMTNAIKYGGTGPIDVRVTEQDGRVTVVVVDTGPGIPLHEQQRIFGRFERLDNRDRQAGTGIGLYIARRLAERMGGSLTVNSSPGQGASFVLTVAAAEDPDGAPQATDLLAGGGVDRRDPGLTAPLALARVGGERLGNDGDELG